MALLVLEPVNVLLLDEPTNHLDIVVRDGLKRALGDFEGAVLIVSHDPGFLTGLCNRTFEVSEGKLKNLNCSFDDYLKYHKETAVVSKNDSKLANNADDFAKRNQEKNRSKKLIKEIESIETKITQLENSIKSIEIEMGNPEFYQNPNYKSELEKLASWKTELNTSSEIWEDLNNQLDNL